MRKTISIILFVLLLVLLPKYTYAREYEKSWTSTTYDDAKSTLIDYLETYGFNGVGYFSVYSPTNGDLRGSYQNEFGQYFNYIPYDERTWQSDTYGECTARVIILANSQDEFNVNVKLTTEEQEQTSNQSNTNSGQASNQSNTSSGQASNQNNTASGSPLINLDMYNPGRVFRNDAEPMVVFASGPLGAIQVIGVFISVISLVVIGIRYIFASIEEKAEYKERLMPYVIGAVLVFAASSLINIIYEYISSF